MTRTIIRKNDQKRTFVDEVYCKVTKELLIKEHGPGEYLVTEIDGEKHRTDVFDVTKRYAKPDGYRRLFPDAEFEAETLKWRKRDLEIKGDKKKKTIDQTVELEWCHKEIADHIVCLVKADGMIGISYCHSDDRKPHWNPEKSIELAYERRKINDRIKFVNQNPSVELYVAIEYSVFGKSLCPHGLARAVRKLLNNSFAFEV